MADSTTKTRVPAAQPPEDRATESGPTVAWTYYPTLQRRHVALAVLGLLLAVGVLVGWMTDKLYLGAIATLAGVISVWRLYVPIRYELNHQGVTQRVWRRRSTTDWRFVGQIELLDDGLRLLPALRFGGFDALRAIIVPWGTHRGEVLRCVEFHAPYLVKGMGHGTESMEEGKSEEHGARGMEKEQGEAQRGSSTTTESRDG